MKKWMKWVLGITMIANGVLFVIDRNLCALLWLICCGLWIWIADSKEKIIKMKDAIIEMQDERQRLLVSRDAVREMKNAECWRANCERAMKKMMILKNLNKSLFVKIEELNKLCINQSNVIKTLRTK